MATTSTGTFALPVHTLSGSSTSRAISGQFALPVPIPSGQINNPTTRSSGTFILPVITMEGRLGGTSHGTFILPVPVFGNLAPSYSEGSFELPSPVFAGFGRLDSEMVFKTVVMNVSNQGISTYDDYPFNSLSSFDGHLYGAKNNGIYLLEGDKNGGMGILSKVKTHPLNFGNAFLKVFDGIWLCYRSAGHLALILATKEDGSDRTSELQTEVAGSDIHEERVKTPRGLRGRYQIVELVNLSGADFDLAKIRMIVDTIRR